MPLSPDTLPAVLIGGPPHSGKSVLLYALSQALRQAGVEHYALRACPDGEGDWSQEATPETVRAIRIKGGWTPEWVDRICRDIHNRHLPLLVDVGGRPTPDQERIFDACTHAILLTKDASSHAEWHERIARHTLPVLADLTSVEAGESVLQGDTPLTGAVAGLTRHQPVANPVIDALQGQLSHLFANDAAELRRRHLRTAPVELAVDLDRIAVTLGWAQPGAKVTWQPRHLPGLLDYLPAAKPLAIYGRAPVWVYAALAGLAAPAPLVSFDVRLGWVTPPTVHWGAVPTSSPVTITIQSEDDHVRYDCQLPTAYIDRNELDTLAVPEPSPHHGVVVNGKLPQWLWTALTPALAHRAPWVAVYWPQGNNQAIIVAARDPQHPIGTLVSSQAGH
jgi:CRISPR-associated protein Csx3